ncbi:MAG: MarR family transcriptional regulator [Candidatus Uhrbacteria bacterium]|nr:MarR family transcriptional regulator [Candidatus Uhrbacteria bacterium]
MTKPFDLQHSLASHMMCIAGRLEQYGNQLIFEPMGLSFSSARILLLIHHGMCTPMRIQEALRVTKSNVSQRLTLLEEKGLIERVTEPGGDQRCRRIALTALGQEKTDELMHAISFRSLELERSLHPDDVATCERVLSTIHHLLDSSLNEQTV